MIAPIVSHHPIVVLHDYFEYAEGGGRLCMSIVEGLDAHLGFGYKTKDHPFFSRNKTDLREYDLNAFGHLRVWKQFKLIRAFRQQTQFLSKYKSVVYSGFYSVCAVTNHTKGKNIYYCHTPPRYMYDQRAVYRDQAGALGRPILQAFIGHYKPLYERAVSAMDLLVTNSNNVQRRIKKHLGMDAAVVYPPCHLERYQYSGQGNFYLSMARLDPLKRVEAVVRAFMRMPKKNLVVVSGGTELKKIRRLIRNYDNIKLLGWVDEKTLIDLLGNCIATIYVPKEEDFGMSPVESMAAGKPVIGTCEGGLVETILDGETGVLIPADLSIEALVKATDWLSADRAGRMRNACRWRAEKFSSQAFVRKLKALIYN